MVNSGSPKLSARDLKATRLNMGLSVAAAAEAMGVARRTLVDVERDGRMPVPAAAKRIADFFGVQVTDLWPVDDEAAA